MASDFGMWTYWRDKYYDLVDALKEQYPDVLAAHKDLRLELVRIEAYEALVDKLMDVLEDGQGDADEGNFPMWSHYRRDHGYEGALTTHYAAELKKNEPLRVALQNITEAKAVLDRWMKNKAEQELLDEDERIQQNVYNAGGRD